jgi:hypothetical protein
MPVPAGSASAAWSAVVPVAVAITFFTLSSISSDVPSIAVCVVQRERRGWIRDAQCAVGSQKTSVT